MSGDDLPRGPNYQPSPEERAERSGGAMESYSGGDGLERIRLAILTVELRQAEEAVRAAEARLRELRGE